jgi:outer membrane surface antigen
MLRGISGLLYRQITLLVLLAGCGSNHSGNMAGLPTVPVPDYSVGDSYRFSDGTAESVVAVDRDQVRWRGADGTYVTSREVMLPRLGWANPTVQGERRIVGPTPLLFPLQPGKSVVFDAERTVRPVTGGTPVAAGENWRCDVGGTVRAETWAGAFDTWRVTCAMTQKPEVPGTLVVRRTFYYAPEIGFYVRREERTGDGPAKEIELAGYSSAEPALPASAVRLRVGGIQQALEREVSGEASSWHDPATGDAGDVQPVRTVRSSQYGWCRDFAEHIHAAGRAYELRGTGCRNPSGIWDIVALTPVTNGNS